ncbi:ankyrin repeat, SAM and basic leucine zipper domain-containing protein 1, partial [Lingula anatina]|uniref:Ankyrin repeat, SAM and basic leucine zipper domain-containing protein 1 n=1 Tax=Lingula anatina TaxID=7574 RepID=A0A1S3IHT8_LINAN
MRKYPIDEKSAEYFLRQASQIGDADIVKQALDYVQEVNVVDKDGSTPLHWAAREGHENILNLLLHRGADRYLTDQYGRTPLHE